MLNKKTQSISQEAERRMNHYSKINSSSKKDRRSRILKSQTNHKHLKFKNWVQINGLAKLALLSTQWMIGQTTIKAYVKYVLSKMKIHKR